MNKDNNTNLEEEIKKHKEEIEKKFINYLIISFIIDIILMTGLYFLITNKQPN